MTDEAWHLGDIIVLFYPGGEAVHSGVYIAENLVFTKNGAALSQPWIYMRLDEMIEYYTLNDAPGQKLSLVVLRHKGR